MKKTLFFNLAKIQRKRDLGFLYLIPPSPKEAIPIIYKSYKQECPLNL